MSPSLIFFTQSVTLHRHGFFYRSPERTKQTPALEGLSHFHVAWRHRSSPRRKGGVSGGVFSWLQSATSPLDVTKSHTHTHWTFNRVSLCEGKKLSICFLSAWRTQVSWTGREGQAVFVLWLIKSPVMMALQRMSGDNTDEERCRSRVDLYERRQHVSHTSRSRNEATEPRSQRSTRGSLATGRAGAWRVKEAFIIVLVAMQRANYPWLKYLLFLLLVERLRSSSRGQIKRWLLGFFLHLHSNLIC